MQIAFCGDYNAASGVTWGTQKLNAELDETLGYPHIILNPQGQGYTPLHKDGGKA